MRKIIRFASYTFQRTQVYGYFKIAEKLDYQVQSHLLRGNDMFSLLFLSNVKIK